MKSLLTGASIVSFMMWMVDVFFAPGLIDGIVKLVVSLF